MNFTPEQVDALQAKLDGSHVAHREQSGRTLSYIEGWWAIAEANRIFGFDAWHRETVTLLETSRELLKIKGYGGKPDYDQWRVSYLARVRITVGDVIREGTGYGSGMGKPEALGDAIESAAKEAETDAMKRALMTFGNPFGLALYDKTQANVGHGEAAPAEKPKRQVGTNPQTGMATAHALKKDAGPDNWDAFQSELLECNTVPMLTKLALGWSSIAERDRWPANWRYLAKEEINKRREVVLNGLPDDDVFPGDRPNSYVDSFIP
jgi:DNA recombination protein Rad52